MALAALIRAVYLLATTINANMFILNLRDLRVPKIAMAEIKTVVVEARITPKLFLAPKPNRIGEVYPESRRTVVAT